MAAARFQVVSVGRAAHVPVPREPDAGAGSWAEIPHPRERGFTWRFMSANNRSVAKSARTAPDVESCLETIRTLQESLETVTADGSDNALAQIAPQPEACDKKGPTQCTTGTAGARQQTSNNGGAPPTDPATGEVISAGDGTVLASNLSAVTVQVDLPNDGQRILLAVLAVILLVVLVPRPPLVSRTLCQRRGGS